MNKQQRDELNLLINNAISKTSIKIAEYEEMTLPIAPENSIGRISRMDAINNKSVAEAALAVQRRKLKNLQFAKSRVYVEDFGSCANCKRNIPMGRLMLMPQSRFCVNCAK
jgi:DnaK suppressor protein